MVCSDINMVTESLKLKSIKILDDGSFELSCPPTDPFPSYDLNVSISKDFKVVSFSFDG